MSGWDTVESTGLLDDADVTITAAQFNYDAGYMDGEQLLMILEGTSNNTDFPEFTQFYSVGKGWETLDHGATVVGEANGFNSRSQYGLWLTKAVELAGSVITDRGTPDNASVWVGLKFHVQREDVDYGDDIGIKQVLLPTAFLGVDSGKVDAPAPVLEAVADTPAPSGASNGSNAVLKAKLIGLAKASDSHDDFIENVMEKHPEVQEDDELFAAILDESAFYADHS